MDINKMKENLSYYVVPALKLKIVILKCYLKEDVKDVNNNQKNNFGNQINKNLN